MLKRFIVGVSVGVVTAIVGLGSTVASYAQQSNQVPFEALSYCGQLDAIARAGKNVADYMVGSADPDGYIWAGRTECAWHNEQADLADRILHPPVVVVPTYLETAPIHNPDNDLALCDQNVGTAWWNDHCTAAGQGENVGWVESDCDGVQEVGEIPDTGRCRQWQRANVDIIPDGTIDPGFGGPYNDCDGIREPGETPSGGRCYH